jgi:hypothetical protein
MLVIFPIFTCTVSLTLNKTMTITVQNEYPDIELVSPVYFCNHGSHYECPVEKTDDIAIMKMSFMLDLDQDDYGGILTYKMQRKINTKSDHPSNKVIGNALEMVRLLVIWKIKCFRWHKVDLMLVEYDRVSPE